DVSLALRHGLAFRQEKTGSDHILTSVKYGSDATTPAVAFRTKKTPPGLAFASLDASSMALRLFQCRTLGEPPFSCHTIQKRKRSIVSGCFGSFGSITYLH
ncbi:MAG: hypothetical protein RIC93_03865, partial [Alphaproteobacteria bacterium]